MARLLETWRSVRGQPRAVTVLALGSLVNRSGSLVLPFLVLYLHDQGVSAAAAGSAVAAFGVGKVLAAPAGGVLVDRYGARTTTVVSMLLAAVCMSGLLGTAWLGTVGTAALAAACGFTSELYRPAVSAIIRDHVPAGPDRVTAFAVYQLGATVGLTIGPAIGGLLAAWSFVAVLVGEALSSLAWAVLAWRALPADPPRPTAAVSAPGRGLLDLLHDRPMMRLWWACLAVNVVLFQAQTTFPAWLSRHGHSTTTYGLLLAMSAVVIVVGQLPLSGVTRHVRPWVVIALGHVLAGVGFGLLQVGPALGVVVLAVIVFSLCETIAWPVTGAWVTEHAPEHRTGLYAGARSLTFGLGLALAPALSLLPDSGPLTPWTACLLLGALAAALVLRLPAPGSPDPSSEGDEHHERHDCTAHR